MNSEMLETIKNIIDRVGVNELIGMLEMVCHEKADHLRMNRRDPQSAKSWEKQGDAFARISLTVE